MQHAGRTTAKPVTSIGSIWKFTLLLSAMGMVLGVLMAVLGAYRESIFFYDSVEEMERHSVHVPVEIRRHQPPRRGSGWSYLAIRTDGKYGTYDPHWLAIAPGFEGRSIANLDPLTNKPLVAYISQRSKLHQGGRMVSAYTAEGVRVLKAQPRSIFRNYLLAPFTLTFIPILYFLIHLPGMLKMRQAARDA